MNPYIPHSEKDIKEMLEEIGVSDISELFSDIPEKYRNPKINLPPPMGESELWNFFEELSERNVRLKKLKAFLGGGIYHHYIPAVVRHITGRGEFYTAYTPYQPEASQGTLQAIFEYQTIVCELFNMDVANASMYDGSTALAEACLMAMRLTGRDKVVISRAVHPEYREVVKTYVGEERVVEIPYDSRTGMTGFSKVDNPACIVLQNPNFFGIIEDLAEMRKLCDETGARMVVCVTEPLSLGIIAPPGDFGCDIAVGEGQSLCLPPSFSGPHLGLFACKKEYVRQMPGRLVGETIDLEGKKGYVLTLSTREQHIRREKATSNICTNSGLNAIAFAVALSYLGAEGLRKLALINLSKAHYFYELLIKSKVAERVFTGSFFNEFVVRLRKIPERFSSGIMLERWYEEMKNCVLFAVTELNTKEEMQELIEEIKE